MGVRQPSRWDKDKAFERRCREEGIRVRSKHLRDNPLPPDVQTMTFGKFKGEAISNVNTDYLKWLIKNLDFVPDYIATELFKRNELKGVPKEKRKRLRNLAKSRIKTEERKPNAEHQVLLLLVRTMSGCGLNGKMLVVITVSARLKRTIQGHDFYGRMASGLSM